MTTTDPQAPAQAIPTHLTDEALKATQKKGGGWGRAAGYLLELPVAQREAAETEGTIFGNVSPGWRYADAIRHTVQKFQRGNTATPLTDWNRDGLERERNGTLVPGGW
jgi:hypothetical protein